MQEVVSIENLVIENIVEYHNLKIIYFKIVYILKKDNILSFSKYYYIKLIISELSKVDFQVYYT